MPRAHVINGTLRRTLTLTHRQHPKMTLPSFGEPKNDNLCRRWWQNWCDDRRDSHAHTLHTGGQAKRRLLRRLSLHLVRCAFFVASSHSISSNSSLPKAYLLKTYSTHSAAPGQPQNRFELSLLHRTPNTRQFIDNWQHLLVGGHYTHSRQFRGRLQVGRRRRRERVGDAKRNHPFLVYVCCVWASNSSRKSNTLVCPFVGQTFSQHTARMCWLRVRV